MRFSEAYDMMKSDNSLAFTREAWVGNGMFIRVLNNRLGMRTDLGYDVALRPQIACADPNEDWVCIGRL